MTLPGINQYLGDATMSIIHALGRNIPTVIIPHLHDFNHHVSSSWPAVVLDAVEIMRTAHKYRCSRLFWKFAVPESGTRKGEAGFPPGLFNKMQSVARRSIT